MTTLLGHSSLPYLLFSIITFTNQHLYTRQAGRFLYLIPPHEQLHPSYSFHPLSPTIMASTSNRWPEVIEQIPDYALLMVPSFPAVSKTISNLQDWSNPGVWKKVRDVHLTPLSMCADARIRTRRPTVMESKDRAPSNETLMAILWSTLEPATLRQRVMLFTDNNAGLPTVAV